ncbi:MAG: hypothetical protein JW891_03010 [Candidatus Lokiarchaeota archaeon]|nr:hypothetical protein [Candidatus Lokiarchaeota archaeon]
MKKVRGSVFIPVVRAIKGDKSDIFDSLITEEAKELIANRILSSAWYPFDLYKNCMNAVSKVGAKGNYEVLKKWGEDYYDEILPTVYKKSIRGNNVKNAMDMYKRFIKMIYDFGEVILEYPSNKEVNIIYKDYDDDFIPFFYITNGLIEKFVEKALEKRVKSDFIRKSWEQGGTTILKVTW